MFQHSCFFQQWRKQQKCDVYFSCFSSLPALSCLSLLLRHSKQHHKANDKKQRAFMQSSSHLRSLVHLWLTFFSDLQNLTRIVWIQVWWPSTTHPPTQTLLYIHTDTLTGLTAALWTGGQVSGLLGARHTQVLIRQTKMCAEGAGSDAATSGPLLPRYNRVSVPARSFHLSISHRESEDLQTRQKVDWVNANKLSGAVLLTVIGQRTGFLSKKFKVLKWSLKRSTFNLNTNLYWWIFKRDMLFNSTSLHSHSICSSALWFLL